MRVSREKAAENRERIVETASRLFREHGFDRVGIDAIMHAVGLTHGGFYGHFRSKDDLAAAAVTCALESGLEKQSRYSRLEDVVSAYLSAQHCADRAHGCAVAALGADLARQGEGVRHRLTAYVRELLDLLGGMLKTGDTAARRNRAIVTLTGMVGALTLARAVDDPVLSEEILLTMRNILQGAAVPRAAPSKTHNRARG
jgi:TetR/AcrR family transcriptional regulator, transcriptional repressor for nem operon